MCEFSALKSCVKKRMRIPDEPSGGSHLRVVFSESEKTAGLMRMRVHTPRGPAGTRKQTYFRP